MKTTWEYCKILKKDGHTLKWNSTHIDGKQQ